MTVYFLSREVQAELCKYSDQESKEVQPQLWKHQDQGSREVSHPDVSQA